MIGGSADWILLLQVDSDSGVGMEWVGGEGRLYFWIREQDLAEGRFDSCQLIVQVD